MDIAIDKIRELAELAREKNLAELTVQDGEKVVTIKLPAPAAYNMSARDPIAPVVYTPPAPPPTHEIPVHSSHDDMVAKENTNLCQITAPMVGTFYSSPSPDADPFVGIGQTIRKGDTVCIIEAMKMMNELESDVSGRVVQVLAENGQSVEFGQVLMMLEPA